LLESCNPRERGYVLSRIETAYVPKERKTVAPLPISNGGKKKDPVNVAWEATSEFKEFMSLKPAKGITLSGETLERYKVAQELAFRKKSELTIEIRDSESKATSRIPKENEEEA
jgi:hypothetical protein